MIRLVGKLQAVVAQQKAELARATGNAAARVIENKDIVTWIEKNRFILGKPFSFTSAGPIIEYGYHDIRSEKLYRPYLLEVLRDQSQERSVIKCRQQEITETHINEALFYCITRPYTSWAHIFPTDGLGDDVSNEKIEPAISGSPRIVADIEKLATRRYQFKTGSFYVIMGAFKKSGGRARTMDGVTYDEFDLMPESILAIYDAQMEHSSLRLKRLVSTPTVPGIGIHGKFLSGSQAEWNFICPKCKSLQTFQWPDNCIGFFEPDAYEPENPEYQKKLDRAFWGCKFCKNYIDRNSVHYLKTAQWLHAKPSLVGKKSSYQIVAAMSPWKTAKEILGKSHAMSAYTWQWYNEVWGAPYLKGENRISLEEILQCTGTYAPITQPVSSLSHISMGVDWGETQSWVVISASGANQQFPDRRCVIYIEEINAQTLKENGYPGQTTDHVYRVRQLAEWFQCDIVVNDANGIGTDRNQYLINQLPNRAWGAFFDTAEIGRQLRHSKYQVPLWTANRRRVVFSKVFILKELQNEYRRKFVTIPKAIGRYAPAVQAFQRHQQSLAIQPRIDPTYQREIEVAVKVHPEDHFCFIGETLIKTEFGDIPIKDIKVGDKVITRQGLKKVYEHELIDNSAITLFAVFSNGSILEATPDHKIKTVLEDKRLDALLYTDNIITWENVKAKLLQLSTKEFCTEDTRIQQIERTESTLRQMDITEKENMLGYISKSGLIIMDQFLRGFVSIIKIMIRLIMRFQIWNLRKLGTIYLNTHCSECKILNTLQNYWRIWLNKGHLKNSERTTNQKHLEIMHVQTRKNHFFLLSQKLIIVLNVALKLSQKLSMRIDSVWGRSEGKLASVQIVGTRENIERRCVYSIAVESAHEYFANGILVANCDAHFYSKIGWDRLVGHQGISPGVGGGRIGGASIF